MKFTVKETEINFNCNYSYLKKLGEKWNCKGIGALFSKMSSIESAKADLEFEAMTTLTDMLQTAIEVSGSDVQISEDDVFKLLFESPQLIADLITEISKSMPVDLKNEKANQPKKKAVKK